MAFTFVTNTGNTAYNIDWAVGVTGTNMKADVMLVQSAFNIFYFDHEGNPGESKSQRFFPPADVGRLVVDGIYGPLTQRYIDQFEDSLRAADGWTMKADRRMDPFMGHSRSPTQHEVFALVKLARFCHFGDFDTGVFTYRDLPNDPATPLTLRNALARRKKVADQYTFHPATQPKEVFTP